MRRQGKPVPDDLGGQTITRAIVPPRPSGRSTIRQSTDRALQLEAWHALIALGASPSVKVAAVGAVNVAAPGLFTLQRPNILSVVVAFERRLAEEPLAVAVQVTFLRRHFVSPVR